jgi:hypothetical protein
LWQDGGTDLVLLIGLLWQVDIVFGLLLPEFQVKVSGFLDFHNFDLKPHSNIFLAH